ncbi:endonuclease/exonuclease/phosphatase family protein [Nesterenkonia alba]|uniref:endonuclease/exonuclease/phosphatase family protein n=1 Tax=Nesterenkonia alba TaxID=515814 RepID=UPI0003B4D1C9|nr:endonuclease/exonuclease/phosphatase family protein [Nesterenkonia alba]
MRFQGLELEGSSATVVDMPQGLDKPAHRKRGIMAVGSAAVLAASFLLGTAPAAQSAQDDDEAAGDAATSESTYPAPGQPRTPDPSGDPEVTTSEKNDDDVRVATLHADLTADPVGDVGDPLESFVDSLSEDGNHEQARTVAQTVQINQPDVLVLTGVSYDDDGEVAEALRSYLARGQYGQTGIDYPHVFTAGTNSGVDSGADLDGDGSVGGPGDAIGHGDYPGEHGMIVFSKYPIIEDEVRTFQHFLWRDMPDSSMPEDRYSELEESIFRLAQTTVWDVPVEVEGDSHLHVVATSAAAPEDPTEVDIARAEDTMRLMTDYVSGDAWYIYDDEGETGGLPYGSDAVVVGTPLIPGVDSSTLTTHHGVQDPQPEALTEVPLETRPGGEDATDETATRYIEAGEDQRASFVLPTTGLEVTDSAVFWPGEGEYGYRVVNPESEYALSDRLVWADLSLED